MNERELSRTSRSWRSLNADVTPSVYAASAQRAACQALLACAAYCGTKQMSRRVGIATLLCLVSCRRCTQRHPQIPIFAANRGGHHAGERVGRAGEGRHAQYRQLMIG